MPQNSPSLVPRLSLSSFLYAHVRTRLEFTYTIAAGLIKCLACLKVPGALRGTLRLQARGTPPLQKSWLRACLFLASIVIVSISFKSATSVASYCLKMKARMIESPIIQTIDAYKVNESDQFHLNYNWILSDFIPKWHDQDSVNHNLWNISVLCSIRVILICSEHQFQARHRCACTEG